MKKLLWVGDAGCPSGFARSTHEVLDTLRDHFEVTVLGINYRGDPHQYPYPIWAAYPGGDLMGFGRILWMCDQCKPDIIVLQNDPWNLQPYLMQLKRCPDYAHVPVVGFLAVDGKNIRGEWFKGLSHAIFWTKFGLEEARLGGYKGSAGVVPLGVDTQRYKPGNKQEARTRLIPGLENAFIVGNVNRNQSRKRWDLTIRYFAEWVKTKKVDDAYLYLHVAPTGESGCDPEQLMRYYGVLDRLALRQPETFYGDDEDKMVDTYNCFDVQVSTSQGEGFGLTTFEGMACGIPQILPKWSALAELCEGAAWFVPCTSVASTTGVNNVIGGVADEKLFVAALDALYNNPQYRVQNAIAALERARQPRFDWRNIGKAFLRELNTVLQQEEVSA